jgi:hypothetical protein
LLIRFFATFAPYFRSAAAFMAEACTCLALPLIWCPTSSVGQQLKLNPIDCAKPQKQHDESVAVVTLRQFDPSDRRCGAPSCRPCWLLPVFWPTFFAVGRHRPRLDASDVRFLETALGKTAVADCGDPACWIAEDCFPSILPYPSHTQTMPAKFSLLHCALSCIFMSLLI